MVPVENSTFWVLITDLSLQAVLDQAQALDPVLVPVSLALVLALILAVPQELEVLVGLVAQLPLTRTSFTNLEPRSWLIRC